MEELEKSSDDVDAGGLLGLPETETELDVSINKKIMIVKLSDNCTVLF